MEKSLPVPKHERRWQLSIYAMAILLMMWDLWLTPLNRIFADFKSFSPFFLYITFPLLSIGWLVALKSPRLAARSAVVASSISLMAYLIIGFINLLHYQSYALEILRFYLSRIFSFGVVLIYSYKILQSPTEQAELFIPVLFFKLRWTPKIQKYVVSAFVIIFSILGIQWLYPRASCAVIGGRWIRDGILGQAQYCLHSYPDAGKACQSSEDCLGRCLADTNSSSVITGVPTTGVCAPNNRVFGCFEIFDHQEITLLCID